MQDINDVLEVLKQELDEPIEFLDFDDFKEEEEGGGSEQQNETKATLHFLKSLKVTPGYQHFPLSNESYRASTVGLCLQAALLAANLASSDAGESILEIFDRVMLEDFPDMIALKGLAPSREVHLDGRITSYKSFFDNWQFNLRSTKAIIRSRPKERSGTITLLAPVGLKILIVDPKVTSLSNINSNTLSERRQRAFSQRKKGGTGQQLRSILGWKGKRRLLSIPDLKFALKNSYNSANQGIIRKA